MASNWDWRTGKRVATEWMTIRTQEARWSLDQKQYLLATTTAKRTRLKRFSKRMAFAGGDRVTLVGWSFLITKRSSFRTWQQFVFECSLISANLNVNLSNFSQCKSWDQRVRTCVADRPQEQLYQIAIGQLFHFNGHGAHRPITCSLKIWIFFFIYSSYGTYLINSLSSRSNRYSKAVGWLRT